MRTIACALAIVLIGSLAATRVSAKRSEPKAVPPITRNGVVYSVPHEHMGFVIAKDEKLDRELWTKQVYVVKYDPVLEKDVQDCFVTELRVADDKLIVSNENGDQFELNPATLAVKVLKGAEIVDRTAPKKK